MDRGAVLQEGPPSEVVLRPVSRRVAELVGYLGFVPLPVPSAAVAGVHPGRGIAGGGPQRGSPMPAGLVTARPSGAGGEADLVYSDALFTCWLPTRPEGSSAVVTLL